MIAQQPYSPLFRNPRLRPTTQDTVIVVPVYAWLSDLELFYLWEESEYITDDYIIHLLDKLSRSLITPLAFHEESVRVQEASKAFKTNVFAEMVARKSRLVEPETVFDIDSYARLGYYRMDSLITRFINPALSIESVWAPETTPSGASDARAFR
jgi:hypothetical protein